MNVPRIGVAILFIIAGGRVCDGAQPASKSILLLSSPSVQIEQADRCYQFVEHNVRGRTRSDRTLLSSECLTPDEQLRVFSCMRSTNDALVVVLVSSTPVKGAIIAYSEKLGSAVVNIGPVMSSPGLSDSARAARIDRAVMYAIGRLVGVDPCPNPFCALSEDQPHRKDQIPGRNFCPVCSVAVGEALRAVGSGEDAVASPIGSK